ncbi:hypothetical protein GCM10010524_16580 [Streptomyces mexicanus]
MRNRMLRSVLVAAFSAVVALGALGGFSGSKSEVRANTQWPAVAAQSNTQWPSAATQSNTQWPTAPAQSGSTDTTSGYTADGAGS